MELEIIKKEPESLDKVDIYFSACYEDTVHNLVKNLDSKTFSKELKKRVSDKLKDVKDFKKYVNFKTFHFEGDSGIKFVVLVLRKSAKPFDIQSGLKKSLASSLKELRNTCVINIEEVSKPTQELIAEYISCLSKISEWKSPVYGKRAKDDGKKKDKANKKILLLSQIKESDLTDLIQKGSLIGEATNTVRHLASLPGNYLNPEQYQEILKDRAIKNKFIYRFFDYDKLNKMNAGAFSAVLSADPQNHGGLVHIHCKPKSKSLGKIVIVGKGLCYDTGGLNVKPDKYMYSMHRDMTGSAVALAVFETILKLQLPYEIDGLLALAENHISPSAYKPNDVVTAMNGKSIEVVHTDAEGRMVLSDALCFASDLKPDLIIDFATLTGSATRAIGTARSCIFSNSKKLLKVGMDVGDTSGERVWAFPIGDEYLDGLKSEVADIKQCSLEPGPDHIQAASFLNEFVEDGIPWLHVDLSAEENKGGLGLVDTDVTGFGVRYAIEVIQAFFKSKN